MPPKPRSTKPGARVKNHALEVVRGLEREYPEVHCALVHKNAYELLVATILSAQCTDVRVNVVTPEFFADYPDAKTLAGAQAGELERIVHSTGFFRAKAKNLLAMAKFLVERHGGEVPRVLEDLTKLPGVGRKTANVVLGTAYGIASGVVVDTHVKRLSFRLGLTKSTDPESIEQDLMALIPERDWINFSHRLIAHGRSVCLASRPRCEACGIERICPKNGVKPRLSKPAVR